MGAVQGITEFLPVSSTGHLRIIPRLFGWNDAGLAFDAALHTGTLLALLVYFWRDWIDVLRPVVARLRPGSPPINPRFGHNLFWGIIIGCIPAGIAGILLDDTIDAFEQSPNLNNHVMVVVASALILVGLVLYAADKYGSKEKKKLADMNFVDWVVIGLAQAVALVPGVSRSGATISAGLFRSLDRAAAARFSFLLSTPIFIGVAILHIYKLTETGMTPEQIAPFTAGLITSAVVGYAAIGFLLGYLRRHGVNLFVWYRLALGIFIFSLVTARI